MNEDVRTFLKKFTADELVRRGVLSPHAGTEYQLNNRNVAALIQLMEEHKITRLEATERNWFLTSDYKFSNPSSGEIKTGDVNDLSQKGLVFNEQNPHINPFYKSAGAKVEPGVDSVSHERIGTEPEEIKFGLERDLQRVLRGSLNQLEPGLEVDDGGSEKTVDAGRIDITAKDGQGRIVVIELKAGVAQPEAVAQLLAYMGTIENPEDKSVRGILVASDFHPRVVHAAKAVSNLALKSYSIHFSFNDR